MDATPVLGVEWTNWMLAAAAFVSVIWTISYTLYKSRGDTKRDTAISDLQRDQAESLKGIAEGVARAVDPARAHELGASISMELRREPYQSSGSTRRELLTLRNIGPGSASIRKVLAIQADGTDGAGIFFGEEPVPGGAVELFPGEAHHVPVAMSFGLAWPLDFVVEWTDGTGDHARGRALTFDI